MDSTQDSIRQLAANSADPNSFYQQFLPLVAQQTNALAGIAWNCTAQPFVPICQTKSTSHDKLDIGLSESKHVSLLRQAINDSNEKSLSLLIRQDGIDTANNAPNENPVIVLSVVRRGDSVELVELFYPVGLAPDVYKDNAKSLDLFCRTAAECELNTNPNGFAENTAIAPAPFKFDSNQIDEYVHQIHRSLAPKETAKQIANEARRFLDCDRVTVFDFRGGHAKATAISGQPSVNNRSNTLYLLRKLVRRVLPTQQTFWYPAENALPPEVDKPLQAYLEISATRTLVAVPIFDKPPANQEEPDAARSKNRVVGGLVFEHCLEQWDRTEMEGAVETVSRHASDAYRNAYSHRQLLFYPVWKWLGKSKVVLAARNLPKTIAASIGVIGLALLLAFCPSDLKVTCDGILVPAERQKVFVPLDGTVDVVAVSHGSTVSAGQTLVKLINNDLENQATELDGRIVELKSKIESTETLMLSPNVEDQELGEQNLSAQKAQLASLERQSEMLGRKRKKLIVTSPIDGQVVTWNIVERLKMRPVSRGDELLEVVNPEGNWQLELDAPDRNVGHIQDALSENDGEPLDVEFILAADPSRRLKGKLIEIGKSTRVSPENGPTVSMKIKIEDQEDLDIRQIKSSVSANIICKKTSLGYSLFHGVTEFIQKHWFRLF